MARETLKDFLKKDPYGAATSTEKIDYKIDDGGDGSADPYLDDLDKNLKNALGRYTHHVTAKSTHSNKYAISNNPSEFKLRDDDGNPSAYTSGDGGEERRYLQNAAGGPATVVNEQAKNYFETISGGGDPKTRAGGTFSSGQLGDVIDKSGKQKELAGDHTVLDAAVMDLISPVLVTANRFDPSNNTPYIPSSPMSNGQVDSLKFASKQSELGEYNEDSASVDLKEMKGIAKKLLIMATGHTPASGGPPSWLGVTTEQLLPSLAQLGSSKVNRADMYAKNRANPGFGGGNADTHGVMTQEDGYRTKSFGTLNSPLEPFSAIPKMGMTTLTIALVLVIEILIKIVAGIMDMLTGSPLGSTSQAERQMGGRKALGSFGLAPDALIIKPSVFGVKHNADGRATQDYKEAVNLGIEVFFGETDIRPQGGFFSFLPGGKNINDSPGYYTIIFRSVIRSTIEIGLAIGDMFKGGLFAILGGIADVLATIRNSKLMAYTNMLASMGGIYVNVVESLEEAGYQKYGLEDGSALVGGISALSARKLEAGSQELRVGKSKYDADVKPGHDTLVWGTGQLPSAYLFAGAVYNLAATSGLGSATSATKFIPAAWHGPAYVSQNFENLKTQVTAGGRLSPEIVKTTEEALDGEYMPFYLHDLRTNEIIAFHAFLTSLSDSYSVNWDKTVSYGRADPVMTYNNTSRTIGLTFMVVATSPADFDEMWWKINKLVTMVYPQYSPGTSLAYGADGQRITAPFSQIPTASPLVRLRLGDLFKSNYSRFSLARLFGLDMYDPAVQAADIDPWIDAANLSWEDIEALTDPPIFGSNNAKFVSKEGMWVLAKSTKGKGKYKRVRIPSEIVLSISSVEQSIETMKAALLAGDLMKMGKYGMAVCKIEDPATETRKRFLRRTNKEKYAAVQNRFGRRSLDLEGVCIPYAELQKSWLFDTTPGTDDPDSELVADPESVAPGLMDPGNNPIVRSFESTRGKGLAGAITQLDFSWLDQATWVTATDGSNAPKACSVTISFQPMHDIAPGLDHNGFNRAPVYNVGPTLNALGSDPWDD